MKFTLRAPTGLLKAHKNDLLVLLRLGAGVNAVESSARLLLKVGTGPSDVDVLSRMLCVCNGLGYLGELVKLIEDKKYLDKLFDLAAKGMPFSPIPVSLLEAREILLPVPAGAGGKPLLRIRDRVAFHWDPEAFRELLDASPGGPIDLWTVGGDPMDRIFTASAYAIAQFTLGAPTGGKSAEDFINEFLAAVSVVGHVLEAAFIGLIVESGEPDPAKYFLKEA